jgi:hypothetical protein
MDDVCFKWHFEVRMLTISKHNYNLNMKHFFRSSFSKHKVGKTGYFYVTAASIQNTFTEMETRK